MCTHEIASKILISLKFMAHNPSSQTSTRSDNERYLDLPTLYPSMHNQMETKSPSHVSPLPSPARLQPLPEITHERGNKFPSITIMPASPPPPKATSPQPLPVSQRNCVVPVPGSATPQPPPFPYPSTAALSSHPLWLPHPLPSPMHALRRGPTAA